MRTGAGAASAGEGVDGVAEKGKMDEPSGAGGRPWEVPGTDVGTWWGGGCAVSGRWRAGAASVDSERAQARCTAAKTMAVQ